MKIHNVKQGSDEWARLRIGTPTASCFDKILRPSDGKLSASSGKYMARLIAEWFTGMPLDDRTTAYMERGTELEPDAAAWYAFDSGSTVEEVGFVTTDDERVGCSPDRFVDANGGLEIKTPGIEQHVLYVLGRPEALYADHKCQVLGNLWLCGREWWEIVSFSPVLPAVKWRVHRDDPDVVEFTNQMAEAVYAFADQLDAAKRKLAPLKAEREAALAKAMETADTGPF